jgi:hypothetical protein
VFQAVASDQINYEAVFPVHGQLGAVVGVVGEIGIELGPHALEPGSDGACGLAFGWSRDG